MRLRRQRTDTSTPPQSAGSSSSSSGAGVVSDASARVGRFARSFSVATRLALVALLVAMVSLVVTAFVGLRTGSALERELTQDRLVAMGASQASRVEVYGAGLTGAIAELAISPGTAEALTSFSDAYVELGGSSPSSRDADLLEVHYRESVLPALAEVEGATVSVSDLVPTSNAAVYLQVEYVLPRDDSPVGEELDDADDGSDWSAAHAELHPTFHHFAVRAGFDDLYLIAANNDTIVYSARKDIDFASSLKLGPFSGSTLAALVETAATEDAGVVVATDFAAYRGVSGAPVAFLAAPVFADDGTRLGAVAARVTPARLNEIMTHDGEWPSGFGETGETFLAAADATMRSDARGFVEAPAAFVAEGRERGTLTESEAANVDLFDTTVLFQRLNETSFGGALEALADGSEVIESINYAGDEVLGTYRPVDWAGLDYGLLTEFGLDEVKQPNTDYARNLIIASAVFIVLITFVAVRWAARIVAPLRIVSERLRRARASRMVGERPELPPKSPREFVELADNIDAMLVRLDERRTEMHERSAERIALLDRFLPSGVVRRAEAGESDVLDQIPQGSVVVLLLHGLGQMVRHASKETLRDHLDLVVADLDDLAAEHGLDRVKLAGGEYVAVCGVSRPYLDHAPRAVAFALEAVQTVADSVAESNVADTRVTAGVDAGALTVGLTGGSRYVYDCWGPPVSGAERLARLPGGNVFVSPAVRANLPSDFELTVVDASESDAARVDAGAAAVSRVTVAQGGEPT